MVTAKEGSRKKCSQARWIRRHILIGSPIKNLCFPKNPPLGLIRELRFRWAIGQPPHFSDLASGFFY